MPSCAAALVLAVALAVPAVASAAERALAGKTLLVVAPTAAETTRRVSIVGQNGPGATPALSDPRSAGATLSVVANGATSSAGTFVLDAVGWQAAGSGYRYVGPTGADGDAVRRVLLRRAANGRYLLRADLDGRVGTQPLALVPPNPGSDAQLVLEVAGGDRYCVAFGGAAGGTVKRNDARRWKVLNAVATSCPAPPTTTSTTTSTTTTTLGLCGNGVVDPGEQCDGASPGCLCSAPTVDPPCQCCLPPMTVTMVQVWPVPCCAGGLCEQTGPLSCTCHDPNLPECGDAEFPVCDGNCRGPYQTRCTAFRFVGMGEQCLCQSPVDPSYQALCPNGPPFCDDPSMVIEVAPGGVCTCVNP